MTLMGRFSAARKRAMSTMVPSDTRIYAYDDGDDGAIKAAYSYTKLQHLILFA